MNAKVLEKLGFNEIKKQLIEYSMTYKGKEFAKALFPFLSVEVAQESLTELNDCILIINSYGKMPIYDIDDLSLQLKKLNSSLSLTAKELLEIGNVLKNSTALKNFYDTNLKENIQLDNTLIKYFESLYTNPNIEKRIFSAIISENEIADDASSELKSIRKAKKQLDANIKQALNKLIHSQEASKFLQENIITIRNNRFVVPVLAEYQNQIKGFVHDASSSGRTLYIEPFSVFEMNNKLQEKEIEEKKEIEKILKDLSALLFPYSKELESNIDIIGTLDFIQAKTMLSTDEDATMPLFDNFFDLIGARNPLIDKNQVIPISLYLGKSDQSKYFNTLVITGPNTGGKTVTLKTVGLLTLMAQSGLNIPCSENSKIRFVDKVFVDIGDEQSIESSLSTFSSHIKNITNIIKNVTPNSLLLFDELGSGTDPMEGASLAISLLEYFNTKKCFTIATTHYSELKKYCLTHQGFENASVEFDVKTLKPTYKLTIGLPGKSYAFEIAKELGIPKEIIEKSRSLIGFKDTKIEDVLKEIFDRQKEINDKNDEIQRNLNQVTLLRKNLEQQNNEKLLKEQQKIEEAKTKAKDILLEAKKESDEIIKQLNKLDSNSKNQADKYRQKLNASLSSINSNLDFGALDKFNKHNTSNDTTLDENKNALKMNFSAQKSDKFYNMKAYDTKTEINLIGENVDTAIVLLEKYLDDCHLAGFNEVRIVHGKGTGKLREGIQRYLKKSKYVKAFRTGFYGEGESGVTIVTLK